MVLSQLDIVDWREIVLGKIIDAHERLGSYSNMRLGIRDPLGANDLEMISKGCKHKIDC